MATLAGTAKANATEQLFDVGGVRLPRPFRVRRLGHFGLNVGSVAACLPFYTQLLGFRIADPLDFGPRMTPEMRARLGETAGYFTRHGSDHHSFVMFPRAAIHALRGAPAPGREDITVNQITWQVGALAEVAGAFDWFRRRAVPYVRSGRDMPGSNWHVYPLDPAGHVNELYYGIEQVGWNGLTKPRGAFEREYRELPELPHRSEAEEVERALARGVDLGAGTRGLDPVPWDERFDVEGVLLPRPFKVVRIGPVRLFVDDVAAVEAFYRDTLGLARTEEIAYRGRRCVFLRANTEHHAMALYPKSLRAELGLSGHTSLFSFGVQLGSYRQLRNAVRWLADRGCTVTCLDPALFPGMDYTAFVTDPDGHAIQLYAYMEQVGWDGRPRPAAERRRIAPGDWTGWPETVDAMSDTYLGEQLLGPLG